jgi:hypothetical protein
MGKKRSLAVFPLVFCAPSNAVAGNFGAPSVMAQRAPPNRRRNPAHDGASAGVDPHRAGSVLRNCDGKKVTPSTSSSWPTGSQCRPRTDEIPFVVARVVLQDFTGVPLLADLAAMRNVAAAHGQEPKTIEPLVPVDLVVDHSVMIDHYGRPTRST